MVNTPYALVAMCRGLLESAREISLTAVTNATKRR